MNYLYARKRGIPKSHFVGLAAVWKTFKKAIWALMMPLIIIGGIMSGMVTATESGMIATVYGLIYGFASKNLTLKTLKKCIDERGQRNGQPDADHLVCGPVWLPDHL